MSVPVQGMETIVVNIDPYQSNNPSTRHPKLTFHFPFATPHPPVQGCSGVDGVVVVVLGLK